MSYRWVPAPLVPSIRSLLELDRRDVPWLSVTLGTGVAVSLLYIALNRYPASGAGLYTVMADQIRVSGYVLPRSIQYYTVDGVPFAYPPLAFYGLAVLRDLGAGTFATARFLPPLFVIAALVPAYLLGRDLLDGRLRGAGAAVLVAINPQVLQWHLSAGGVVRGPGFLLALTGAYGAYRLFRDRTAKWAGVGLVLFALSLLTHPTYALFVGVTYAVFWAGYDRSIRGLLLGVVVAVGGVAVTAPWWLTVASRYGFDVFTAAAGTHGSLGGGLLSTLAGVSIWSVPFIVAAVIALVGGWRVLGAWFVVVFVLFKQPRFAYTVGAFAVVAAAVVCRNGAREWYPTIWNRRRAVGVATLVVLSVAGIGVVGYDFSGIDDQTTPEFVDDDDVAAMSWAEHETPPDATFVVLGDAAEWFPALTHRTILVAPWGMEWRGPAAFDRQTIAYENLSVCQSARCVERWTASVHAPPEYIYVPKGRYSVRGERQVSFGTLQRSLSLRNEYERVFENEGVALYRQTSTHAGD